MLRHSITVATAAAAVVAGSTDAAAITVDSFYCGSDNTGFVAPLQAKVMRSTPVDQSTTKLELDVSATVLGATFTCESQVREYLRICMPWQLCKSTTCRLFRSLPYYLLLCAGCVRL